MLGSKRLVSRVLIVLLNAAAALLVAGKASSLQDGLQRAAKSLDSGNARSVLAKLREVCG